MSDNYRKNVNTYKMTNFYVRATVYRPNSMRAVSAEKELNRLQAKLDELQTAINTACNTMDRVPGCLMELEAESFEIAKGAVEQEQEYRARELRGIKLLEEKNQRIAELEEQLRLANIDNFLAEEKLAELEEIIICLETDMPMADRLLNQRVSINRLTDKNSALEATIKRIVSEIYENPAGASKELQDILKQRSKEILEAALKGDK